jgi:uncharacterized protein (TIGR03086 family)
MSDTEILERAFTSTRSVLERVSPDQLDLPTPCASWTVRGLVNHMVGGPFYFASCLESGTHPAAGATDYAAGDIVGSYDDGAARAVAAFGAPGAGERMITLPFGTLPGSVFIGIASTDVFAHGWDLARATAQPCDLDPQLAAQLLERARAMLPESMRGPDGKAPFGPSTQAPAGATAADELAAFLGRPV